VDEGKMVATKRFLMGGSRWAMEMWIGSHPSIAPCDLSGSPTITAWMAEDRNTSAFSFSMFPRHGHDMRSMFDRSLPRYRPELLDSESTRMRDYNLLGGMILRWRLMYGQLPSISSWMWSYYPDGDIWLNGVEKHGDEKVYEALTAKFWPVNQETDANAPAGKQP
jgi:hypothetical protein